MKNFSRSISVLSLWSLLLLAISPIIGFDRTEAVILNTDYFTIEAATESANAGEPVEFTISARQQDGQPRSFMGGEKAYIEIVKVDEVGLSRDADITAVGAGLSVTSVGSGEMPFPLANGNNLIGTNDNVLEFNLNDGAAVNNTFTVSATDSYQIFVYSPGAGINPPDVGEGNPAGQDVWAVDVAAGSGNADHLRPVANENQIINEPFEIMIRQVNAGGGLDTAELVGGATVTLGGLDADVQSVNGDTTGYEGVDDTVAIVELVDGIGFLEVVAEAEGFLMIDASTDNLPGMDELIMVNIGQATPLEIKHYGPGNGQIGVPTMAPVDVMLSGNPDPEGLIFPLENSANSEVSITDNSGAVAGFWEKFTENFGGQTFYRVSFKPNGPLDENTQHTVAIKKSFVNSTNLVEAPDLNDNEASFDFTFTTGVGGGEFIQGGDFGGDMGGEFPPMVFLSYPQPHSWDVPTNINCINLEFDRPMKASTLTTANIYVKKMVSGLEVAPAGVPTVTIIGSENRGVCLSGITYDANSQYRVVVTRSVTDQKGTPIAGMPVDEDGNALNGFGFGFANMGPFKEVFNTGAGAKTVTSSLMGLNIDQYKQSDGSITGVPTGVTIRASFNNPLDSSTVTSSTVTLKKNNSISVSGSVSFDSKSNSIQFYPNEGLLPSTSYTFSISTAVESNASGTPISAVSKTFTTGLADVTAPKLSFADADNYGIFMHFDEPLKMSTAEDKGNYTVKYCTTGAMAADGSACGGGGTLTTVSLLSGVNIHYESSKNAVWMDGLTLTPGKEFYVEVGNSVTDASGSNNSIDPNADSWVGKVMDASKFAGGQGMFNMDSMGFEDFDMGMMGMKPINVMPMSPMAGKITKYFVDIPLADVIPAGGTIELSFPAGFDVTNAKQDSQSPINGDFNGPQSGTITFHDDDPSGTGFTQGGELDDGIAVVSGARKVVIKLSAETDEDDFLHFDLDGIKNSNEPKDFNTAGYQVSIKTYNTQGEILEAMTSMPFFISSSGSNKLRGVISDSDNADAGLNGVKVMMDCPMIGHSETLTANGVFGVGDGEYEFENVPSTTCAVFTEPLISVGMNDYSGQPWPLPVNVNGVTTQNFSLSRSNSDNGATQPISITSANLGAINSLGFNDSIDVFASSQNGFVVKTFTRAQIADHIADPEANPINIFLPSTGKWEIGIGPALPKTGTSKNQSSQMVWMPPRQQSVSIAASDIGGADKPALTFAISGAEKFITGKVLDNSGNAVASAEVFAYSPQKGIGNHAQSKTDGTFSIPVSEGSFVVGAHKPGMPPSKELPVLVKGGSFYVGGSATASTGVLAGNPFNIKLTANSSGITVQGRVTDGTNVVNGASVWGHRTDGVPGFVETKTDQSGNYTLYVSQGAWQIEAHAPSFGYLGSKTLSITQSLTGQNFEPNDEIGTINGQVSDDNGPVQGAVVWAQGPNGFNETKTGADGTYALQVPFDSGAAAAQNTYSIHAFIPGIGDLPPINNVVVNGDEEGHNFVAGGTQTFTITIEEVLSEDTFVKFFSNSGNGNGIMIPAGETTAVASLPEGEYFIDVYTPGIDMDNIDLEGAEFNNINGVPSSSNRVDIDGTDDDIDIILPPLLTISGTIDETNGNVENTLVSIVNEETKESFGVLADENGEWTAKVEAGDYSVFPSKPGYFVPAQDVDTTDVGVDDAVDFTLIAASRTIAGTVSGPSGVLADAFVSATKVGGGFASATTATDGSYILSLSPGIWTVKAVGEGYTPAAGVQVNVSTASATGKNFTLTARESQLNAPKTKPITPSAGGTITDSNTGTSLIIPPNSLGSGSSANSITVKETNNVVDTPTAEPLGGVAQEITAKDSNGTPITNLSEDVTISFNKTIAQLAEEDVDTYSEINQLSNAYFDEASSNWVSIPTSIQFLDSDGSVIAGPTVAASESLEDAGVESIKLVSTTDHFTVFAPIVPNGATPPDTPVGLAATAGDGEVILSWTKNSEVDMSRYDIWEANVSEGVLTTLTQAACAATPCTKTIDGLTNGTEYTFQIIAVDLDGNESAGSDAVDVTPVAAAAPSGSSGGGGGPIQIIKNQQTEQDTENEEESEKSSEKSEQLDSVKESENSTPFVDIADSWATEYIEDLYKKGIISGFDANHYKPANDVTRAELTKMAVNMFKLKQDSSFKIKEFKDIKDGDWFKDYIYIAQTNNIISGYSDGTFRPNSSINRAEALKILLDAAKVNYDVVEQVNFEDIEPGIWFEKYLKFAVKNGIVKGYEDGTFRPGNHINRAEVAKIVSIILSKNFTNDTKTSYLDNLRSMVGGL